jgi:hypothetical protein
MTWTERRKQSRFMRTFTSLPAEQVLSGGPEIWKSWAPATISVVRAKVDIVRTQVSKNSSSLRRKQGSSLSLN